MRAAKLGRKQKISQIADRIYIMESSGGVQDSCLALGKFNGYGFMDGGGGKQTCYPSAAIVRKNVEAWVGLRVDAMPLAELVCYYNLGKLVKTCPYYTRYINLK